MCNLPLKLSLIVCHLQAFLSGSHSICGRESWLCLWNACTFPPQLPPLLIFGCAAVVSPPRGVQTAQQWRAQMSVMLWDSPARSPKVSLQLPSFPKPRTRVVKELVCILGLQRETSTLTWAKVAARKCTLSSDPISKNCARKERLWGSSLEWWCSQVFTSPLCDYPCGKYSCRQIWHSLIKMRKALMSTLLREKQS